MPVAVAITYHNEPRKLIKRTEKAARSSMLAAARFWHRRILPIHFTFAANRRYAYEKRTKAYQIKKAKLRRHQNPLVWSGKSRNMAIMLGRFVDRRTNQGQSASARLPVPKYFFLHPHNKKTGKFIDKPAEMARTTRDEEMAIAELARRRVLRSYSEKIEKLRIQLR